MLNSQLIDYQSGDTTLQAYCVYDAALTGKRPGVLVCHDWSGKNDFACQRADQPAQLGYVGFALDMYGKGKLGRTKEEKSALIQPLMQDRQKLQQRVLAGLAALQQFTFTDSNRIGAIGFCFGGLCALDLARSGANIKGVVSFHGLLQAPEHLPRRQIKAKILALHGYNDPMVPPEQVIAFANEMTQANANWQLDIYGNALHAFTNPQANDPAFGTVYNQQADTRSAIAMHEFFKEIF